MKFSTSFATIAALVSSGMNVNAAVNNKNVNNNNRKNAAAKNANKNSAVVVKGLKSREDFAKRLLLQYTNRNPITGQIGGVPPGDGKCDIEHLDEEHLKGARIFQKWFVETYLGGKYIDLKDEDKKLDAAYELYDEYVDPFYGFITMSGIDDMGDALGLDLEWLKFYVNCLFKDYALDEDELLKAICVGEPHFTTWQGANFDYHGACDLVLIHNPSFDSYKGMDLHVRTEQVKTGEYSFVSDAALRLGDDNLEIRKTGEVFFNKASLDISKLNKPISLGGFPVTFDKSDKCFDIGSLHKCVPSQTATIQVGQKETIVFKVFKEMVHVEVSGRPNEMAMGASGLMGTYPGERHGRIARDGFTLMQDQDEFGQEWQVRQDEPKLFVESRYPQYPQTCIAPTDAHASRQRTLRAGLEAEEKLKLTAKQACEHVVNESSTYKNCIFDVMATGDESHAMIYGAW